MKYFLGVGAANANGNNQQQQQQEDVIEVEISFTSILESTVVLVQFIFVILKVVLLIFVNILAHPAFLGFLLLNAVTMFNQPETITFENHSHDSIATETLAIIDHDEAVEYSQSTNMDNNNSTVEAIVEVVVGNLTQAVNNVTGVKSSDSSSTTTTTGAHSTPFPHYLTLILVRTFILVIIFLRDFVRPDLTRKFFYDN